jgi:hypothetical protein
VDALAPSLPFFPLVVEAPVVVEVPALVAPPVVVVVVVVVPTALVFVVEIFGFNDDGLIFGRSLSLLVVPSTAKEMSTVVFVARPPSEIAARFSGRIVMVRLDSDIFCEREAWPEDR